MVALFTILVLLMVAAHMARPQTPQQISAAHFFTHHPARLQNRLQLALPLVSPPFWCRVAAAALMMAAVLLEVQTAEAPVSASVNLWIVLDTSGSMTTIQGGSTRMVIALNEARSALATAEAVAAGKPICVLLSLFDEEIRPAQPRVFSSGSAALQALSSVAARPLGTNLSIVSSAISQPPALVSRTDCSPTHVVVITDMPAPLNLSNNAGSLPVIWRDVGSRVDNAGFVRVDAARDPLTGAVGGIEVTLAAYGHAPSGGNVVVTDGAGKTVASFDPDWVGGVWSFDWKPAPGTYRLDFQSADTYDLDNHLSLKIVPATSVTYQCDLLDCSFFDNLNWQADSAAPMLRISDSVSSSANGAPLLLLGSGYGSQPSSSSTIETFANDSPLLADLNFDVVEKLPINGVPLPAAFQPVMTATGGTWIAQRANPPAVLIPGLPSLSAGDSPEEANASRAELTILFDAVRWLLHERPLAPLFDVTSPANPAVSLLRNALHDGEGDTARDALSHGELADIKPLPIRRAPPVWPIVLTIAAGIFAAERVLAIRYAQWK